MKNMKKKLTLVVMLLFLGGTLTTYASKDFTFCFSSNVIGKKGLSLVTRKQHVKAERILLYLTQIIMQILWENIVLT